jgi:hypothetical protein
MGGRSQIIFGLRAVVLAIVLIFGGSITVAYSQPDGISLVIKQYPAQGGTVAPDLGIHHFSPNEEVALSAMPKPGYKFVCWLGDVSNSQASSTVTQVSGPKVVIAVFESSEHEGLFPRTSAPGGGGKAGPSAGSMAGIGNNVSLMSGGGGKVVPKVVSPDPLYPSWTEDTDIPVIIAPVPEFPVVIVPVSDPVVPEPATGTLLILGSLLVLFKRRTKKLSR